MSFSENFISIMNAIGDKIGIAIDWSSQNIIPYMEVLGNRIVNYEMYTSVAWLGFHFLMILVGMGIIDRGIKHFKNPDRRCYDDSYIFIITFGVIVSIFAFIFGMVEVGDLITATTLPEKTIIEFIMNYSN